MLWRNVKARMAIRVVPHYPGPRLMPARIVSPLVWLITGGWRAIGEGIGSGPGPAPAARLAPFGRVLGEGLIRVIGIRYITPPGLVVLGGGQLFGIGLIVVPLVRILGVAGCQPRVIAQVPVGWF